MSARLSPNTRSTIKHQPRCCCGDLFVDVINIHAIGPSVIGGASSSQLKGLESKTEVFLRRNKVQLVQDKARPSLMSGQT